MTGTGVINANTAASSSSATSTAASPSNSTLSSVYATLGSVGIKAPIPRATTVNTTSGGSSASGIPDSSNGSTANASSGVTGTWTEIVDKKVFSGLGDFYSTVRLEMINYTRFFLKKVNTIAFVASVTLGVGILSLGYFIYRDIMFYTRRSHSTYIEYVRKHFRMKFQNSHCSFLHIPNSPFLKLLSEVPFMPLPLNFQKQTTFLTLITGSSRSGKSITLARQLRFRPCVIWLSGRENNYDKELPRHIAMAVGISGREVASITLAEILNIIKKALVELHHQQSLQYESELEHIHDHDDPISWQDYTLPTPVFVWDDFHDYFDKSTASFTPNAKALLSWLTEMANLGLINVYVLTSSLSSILSLRNNRTFWDRFQVVEHGYFNDETLHLLLKKMSDDFAPSEIRDIASSIGGNLADLETVYFSREHKSTTESIMVVINRTMNQIRHSFENCNSLPSVNSSLWVRVACGYLDGLCVPSVNGSSDVPKTICSRSLAKSLNVSLKDVLDVRNHLGELGLLRIHFSTVDELVSLAKPSIQHAWVTFRENPTFSLLCPPVT